MQYSIVNIKEIQQSVFGDRIDAEFYLPVYLDSDAAIDKFGYKLLDTITSKIDVGHVGSMVNEYAIDGIWLLQTQNVKEFFLDESNKIFINAKFHDYLKKSKVRKGDILIARSGSFGTASIYLEDEEINSADIIIIKPLKEQINPYYLATFLNCKYGTNQLLRFASGGLQGHVNLTILEKLKVCNLSDCTQKHIETIIKESYLSKKASEELYNQSQTLLLSELGLLEWRPKHVLSFVRNYSETEQDERFDAEYFQPKYDEIVKAIKQYNGGWDTLGNLCKLVGHPSNPPYADTDDNDKTFIVTQKHLGDYSLNDDFWKDEDALYTTQEFIKRNNQYVLKQNDVLLYSVGAYIGKANIYNENIKATIGSFLTLLRAKKERINPYYLMAFLNTEIGVMISKQHQRGMAQQYLYPYDIRTFPIPLLDEGIQLQIQQKITESFNLRKQSKHLLECAKKAVEIAIEESETTAMQWLKERRLTTSNGYTPTSSRG